MNRTQAVSLNSSFQLARFPGGSHNETWTTPNYYQTINYFLDEVNIDLCRNFHQNSRVKKQPLNTVIIAGVVSAHGVGQTQGGVPDLPGAAWDCAQCLSFINYSHRLLFLFRYYE